MKTKVVKTAEAPLPTKFGKFRILVYRSKDGEEHAVLFMGDLKQQPVLTRIHSQCLTGDTFSSLRCDCQEQLHESMRIIGKKQEGVIIYLNQEGRGIGLSNKIKAYALQEKGLDTVEANHALGFPTDARDYKVASEILKNLGVSQIALLTNNPEKIDQIVKYGISVVKRVPLEIKPNKINTSYLLSKKQKMNHLLEFVEE